MEEKTFIFKLIESEKAEIYWDTKNLTEWLEEKSIVSKERTSYNHTGSIEIAWKDLLYV